MGQWWLWFAVGLVLYFFLSWFGIEFSTRTQLVFTAATVATLLLLAVVIIGKGGARGNTLEAFSPGAAGVSWPLVFAGMAFGIHAWLLHGVRVPAPMVTRYLAPTIEEILKAVWIVYLVRRHRVGVMVDAGIH